jgi:hypothetical protein
MPDGARSLFAHGNAPKDHEDLQYGWQGTEVRRQVFCLNLRSNTGGLFMEHSLIVARLLEREPLPVGVVDYSV